MPVDARSLRGRDRLDAHDLSVGGMLIASPRPLEIGEKLRVRFVLPRSSDALVGTAWVVRKAQQSQWGLEFLYLDGNGLDVLRQYVG
jgi:hypothetical protein